MSPAPTSLAIGFKSNGTQESYGYQLPKKVTNHPYDKHIQQLSPNFNPCHQCSSLSLFTCPIRTCHVPDVIPKPKPTPTIISPSLSYFFSWIITLRFPKKLIIAFHFTKPKFPNCKRDLLHHLGTDWKTGGHIFERIKNERNTKKKSLNLYYPRVFV